ncbi:helix-turn-helix transcriptional regulator [Cytophagaceae bacterium ABcell3]|nr:helix-turn-helix transcriptional regulator [Cytophagaceae bacterium ABcell3]
MTLGEKIKLTRLKKKLSQQELSEKAGIHQKNISKYEKDLVIPSAVVLKNIADALEVTADYLLGNEDSDTIRDTALFRQFKEVDTMPEDDKVTLMKVISAYIRDFKTKNAYSA